MKLSTVIVQLARGLAIAGGVVLVALTIMTVISIIGRGFLWAGLSSVPGDFELVEAGVAFAIFSFLPWCQVVRGHATVDIFTNFLSPVANRVIDLITELLMTVFITVIAWRLWYGMHDKIRYNEITFILQFPVWWAYALCMVAAVIGVIVSFFLLYVRIREVATGEPVLGPGQGGLH